MNKNFIIIFLLFALITSIYICSDVMDRHTHCIEITRDLNNQIEWLLNK